MLPRAGKQSPNAEKSPNPYQLDTNDGGAWVEGTPFRLQTVHILPRGRSSQRYFSEGVLETASIQNVTSTKPCRNRTPNLGAQAQAGSRILAEPFKYINSDSFASTPNRLSSSHLEKRRHAQIVPRPFRPCELPNYWLASRLKVLHLMVLHLIVDHFNIFSPANSSAG